LDRAADGTIPSFVGLDMVGSDLEALVGLGLPLVTQSTGLLIYIIYIYI